MEKLLPTADSVATPSRGEALVFSLKSRLLQLRRSLVEGFGLRLARHGRGEALADAPLIAESRSELWNAVDPREMDLTAGKVQNLRVACARLDGLEIPAGDLFSFWRQVGRTTRRKGYADGRELREGCVIPNLGGGLCQLSNGLYDAALQAGLEIIERHGHTRTVPGSQAEAGRDATVFWNYVDLRFASDDALRLEVRLTAKELVIRLRGHGSTKETTPDEADERGGCADDAGTRIGNCVTCGMTSCFRNVTTEVTDLRFGRCAFLVDAFWPEHARWCAEHMEDSEGALWLQPLDGLKRGKPNYAWPQPERAECQFTPLTVLRRSLMMRRLPGQGAALQTALLKSDRMLARAYARQLDYRVGELVITQSLLPHLWADGVLGGRRFTVLMTRWPMDMLQQTLDTAAECHPQSTTLADFRVDPQIARHEREALAAAERLVTPHAAMAEYFGERAEPLDWQMPEVNPEERASPSTLKIMLPASALGRKGIFELAEALQGMEVELLVLGRADEGAADPLAQINHRRAALSEMATASAVVLPAWVEHQPRLLLRAIAMGIPVIATAACGLGDQDGVTTLKTPDAAALREALLAVESLSPATV